jgi:hypothetical protein
MVPTSRGGDTTPRRTRETRAPRQTWLISRLRSSVSQDASGAQKRRAAPAHVPAVASSLYASPRRPNIALAFMRFALTPRAGAAWCCAAFASLRSGSILRSTACRSRARQADILVLCARRWWLRTLAVGRERVPAWLCRRQLRGQHGARHVLGLRLPGRPPTLRARKCVSEPACMNGRRARARRAHAWTGGGTQPSSRVRGPGDTRSCMRVTA